MAALVQADVVKYTHTQYRIGPIRTRRIDQNNICTIRHNIMCNLRVIITHKNYSEGSREAVSYKSRGAISDGRSIMSAATYPLRVAYAAGPEFTGTIKNYGGSTRPTF